MAGEPVDGAAYGRPVGVRGGDRLIPVHRTGAQGNGHGSGLVAADEDRRQLDRLLGGIVRTGPDLDIPGHIDCQRAGTGTSGTRTAGRGPACTPRGPCGLCVSDRLGSLLRDHLGFDRSDQGTGGRQLLDPAFVPVRRYARHAHLHAGAGPADARAQDRGASGPARARQPALDGPHRPADRAAEPAPAQLSRVERHSPASTRRTGGGLYARSGRIQGGQRPLRA